MNYKDFLATFEDKSCLTERCSFLLGFGCFSLIPEAAEA